jgi:hypothetical protein
LKAPSAKYRTIVEHLRVPSRASACLFLSFLSPVVVPDPSEEDKLAIAIEYDKDDEGGVVGIAIIVASGSAEDEEAESALGTKVYRESMVTVCEHRVSRSGAAAFQRCSRLGLEWRVL